MLQLNKNKNKKLKLKNWLRDYKNKKMSEYDYPAVASLPLTTMTYVVSLQGNINLEAVYELFSIINIQIHQTRKNVKNIKIPYIPGNEGMIYDINYKGNTRGIVKKRSKKFFKNSVLLDLGLKEKNVAIKISNTSFHITGVKEYQNVIDSTEYLIKFLYTIQEHLDYIGNNPEEIAKIDNWILKNVKGPNDTLIPINKVNDNINLSILNFLTSSLWEFTSFEDFYTVFQWTLGCREIITSDLNITGNKLIMTNYNYDLGFLINRDELAQRLKNETNFVVIYDNSVNYYIKIELPYIRDESFDKIRKKPKVPKHTILVYKSGKVTQSGPGYDLMKICYDKFRIEICKFRPYIERKINFETMDGIDEIEEIEETYLDYIRNNPEEMNEIEETEETEEEINNQPIVKKNITLNLVKEETDIFNLGDLVIC